MFNKNDKAPIKIGLWAGFVASLCCVGPLILITLGIGGASTALAIGKQSPYFLALGVLILIIGLWLHYSRNNKKCNECTAKPFSWQKIAAFTIMASASFLIIYYVLLYILVPWLAPLVYKTFYH